MNNDFEFDHGNFNLEKLLEELQQEREAEYKKLSYQERMEREAKLREAKKRSKEHWESLQSTKDISIAYAKTYELLYGDLLDEQDHKVLYPEEYQHKRGNPYKRYVKNYEENETSIHTNEELNYYLSSMETVYKNNDLEMMYQIYSQLQLKRKARVIKWWHYEISKVIGWEQKKLQKILDQIKNVEEAEIIKNHIIINYNITSLPKGYAVAKKYKQKYRRSTKRPHTYEQTLKKSRRTLEKQLQRTGAGIKHSQALSQILFYL